MKTASTRRAVAEGLFDVIAENKNIVLVSSDSTGVVKAQDFAEKYPDNVMEMGISEQAAMAASAGLASCGLSPVYVSYAVFAAQRACEQLRNTIAYPRLNVKIIGANGGMGSGEREGVTHQGLEDIGIIRSIPGTTVLSPADASQVRKAVRAMMSVNGPVYMRIGSGKDPVFWDEDVPFEIGKPREFFNSGDDLLILSHGFVLNEVKTACEELADQGYGVRGIEAATIKPFNGEGIFSVLEKCRAVITVEDHNVIGGLGSAAAEYISEKCPRPLYRIGLQDRFSESGAPEELFQKYGITKEVVILKAIEALKK